MTASSAKPDPIPAPNLRDWQRVHLERYLATGGEDGYWWTSPRPGIPGPQPTLILTTTGRKSGRRYLNPLIFGEDAGACIVVASRGGAPAHPAWYVNLVATPEVEVQIRTRKFTARARTAKGEERARLWKLMATIYPSYDEYQKVAGREIPVVVLDPA
jgi:deazaflavin-dependent oxidoreductase (nitroreductase family)